MSFILRNVVILYITGFLMSIVFGFLIWYLPLVISKYYGIIMLGYAYSLTNVLLAVSSLIGGYVADIIGRKIALIFSAICLTFSTISLLMIEQSFVAAFLSIILLMLSSSLRGPAAPSLLTESVSQDKSSRFLSLAAFFSTCGMSMGSLVYGYLLTMVGVEAIYLILIVTSVLVVVLCSFLTEINIRRGKSREISFPKMIFHSTPYVCLLITASLWALASSIVEPYLAPVYEQVLKLDVNIIGLVYAITFVLRLVVTSFAGFLIEKLGPIKAIFIDCILSGISLIVFTWLAKFTIYAISLLLIEQALAIMSDIACYTFIAQIIPSDYRGSAYGFLEFLLSTLSIPGPVIGSLIWKISPLYIFTIEGSLLILSIIPVTLTITLKNLHTDTISTKDTKKVVGKIKK